MLRPSTLPTVPAPDDNFGSGAPNVLFDFLRRRWLPLLVCLAVGGAGGWFVSKKYGQTSFTFASLWHYTPHTQTAPHYNPPDVGTIVSLIKSPGLLANLAEEFKLPSGKLLANTLRAEVPYGSQMISLTLEGDEPAKIVAMLNRLSASVDRTLCDTRDEALRRALAQLEAQVVAQRAAVSTAVHQLREFQQREQVVDLEQELQHIRNDIDSLEVSSRTGLTREGTRTDDTAQRRAMLRDLIQEERDSITARNQLTLKRTEYERAKALHDKRYISDAEFQRIATELQTLTEQEQGTVARYRDKLKQYDSYMARNIAAAQPGLEGSPAAPATDLGAENVRERYQELLRERRARLAHLLDIFPQGKELAEAVTKQTVEKDRLELQLSALQQVIKSTDREIAVLQPPRPALDPVKSTNKKILALAAAAIALACAAPLVLLDLFLASRPRRGQAVAQWGLPQLTQRLLTPRGWSQSEPSVDHDEVRRLALRIQQSLPGSNRIALFTSATRRPLDVAPLARLAECLAQRGERVALVELGQPQETLAAWQALEGSPFATTHESPERDPFARQLAESFTRRSYSSTATLAAPTRAVGVVEYLRDHDCPADVTCRPATIAGVDLILSGGALPAEALASRRTTELLDELRERYTLVLVAGPSATQSVDVQMLAARVGAIVVGALGGEPPQDAATRTIAELVETRAPLLGVTC